VREPRRAPRAAPRRDPAPFGAIEDPESRPRQSRRRGRIRQGVSMSAEFVSAINTVSEVLMFENWLRFYFIAEEGDKLFIRVPETAEKRIREEYPHLFGLLELMNNKEITYETSRDAVCSFVASDVDGSRMKAGTSEKVFDSSLFQFEMQLFNIWVQSHEEQLDKNFMDLRKWQELFAEWKRSDKVKEYVAELKDASTRTAPDCDSVQ
jgi:hypothetical protein